MNFKKHALILATIDALHRHGSWTGKTHVQKALSLLRDSRKTDIPFQFILYKHGPYSFEIGDELEQMRSYGAIDVEPNPAGYGVVLKTTERSNVISKFASLTQQEQEAIEDVCKFVRDRTVIELERLATASWIRTQESESDRDRIAKRLHQLKPHVSLGEAENAVDEISRWL